MVADHQQRSVVTESVVEAHLTTALARLRGDVTTHRKQTELCAITTILFPVPHPLAVQPSDQGRSPASTLG